MLQVRAGHCPSCKETTPPGAELCPVCGEDLGWQTTGGKKITTRSTPARRGNGARNILWLGIIFVSAYLVAVLAIATRAPTQGNSADKNPRAKSVQPKPAATSTPLPGDPIDSLLEDALIDGEGPASNSASPPGDASALEAP